MSASGLGRKFQFIREIASGGFGSVYLAKVIHGDGFARLCAVKLLHPKWSENEEIASRMRDEARLLGWLRHKNLVEVLDLTRIGGRVAVLMEYLEAVDVKAVVSDGLVRQEAIPVRVCLEICAAVASALDAAYNRPPYAGEKPLRVIHRDIKPSNIMVDTSGTVKVLDFGVARADFAERESRTQDLSFGSVEYMAPERLFFEPDSPAGDIYALGATLYELLALDKFGKARLRAEQMEAYVEERWMELRQRRTFPGPDVEMEVKLLLRDMLAFDTHDRPTAADCVSRMRIISRRCAEESLQEWAEIVVTPLVAAMAVKPVERSAHSLADQTLGEDSRGFPKDDETQDVAAVGVPGSIKPGREEDEDSLDESGRMSDEQWQKLKQQTLADLGPQPARQGSLPSQASTAAPKKPAPPTPPPPPAPAKVAKAPSPPGDPTPARPKPAPPAPPPAVTKNREDVPPPIRSTIKSMGTGTPEPSPQVKPPPRTAVFRPSDLADDDEPAPRKKGRAGGNQRSEPVYEDETPAGMGLFGKLAIFAVITSIVVLIGAGTVSVLGGGAFWWFSNSSAPVIAVVENIETPAPEAKKAVPAPAAAAATMPAGPVAKFTSDAPGTKKFTVRCNTEEASGTTWAAVKAETSPGDCTITAIGDERKRWTAVVKKVKAAEYICFAGGTKECK